MVDGYSECNRQPQCSRTRPCATLGAPPGEEANMVDEKLIKELNKASGLEAVEGIIRNRIPTPEEMNELTAVALQHVHSALTRATEAAKATLDEKLKKAVEVQKDQSIQSGTKVDTEAFVGEMEELSPKAIAKRKDAARQPTPRKGSGLSKP